MKYRVTVTDSATYDIVADNMFAAMEQAQDWFHERVPDVAVKEIPEVIVNESNLLEVVGCWVETFNDCACCPCVNCDMEFGADFDKCARQIVNETLQCRN